MSARGIVTGERAVVGGNSNSTPHGVQNRATGAPQQPGPRPMGMEPPRGPMRQQVVIIHSIQSQTPHVTNQIIQRAGMNDREERVPVGAAHTVTVQTTGGHPPRGGTGQPIGNVPPNNTGTRAPVGRK